MESLRFKTRQIFEKYVSNGNNSIHEEEDDSSSPSTGNVQQHVTTKRQRGAKSAIKVINPHTILSLEPNQLSETFQIPLDQVWALRKDVADAIANDPSVGHSLTDSSATENAAPTDKTKSRGSLIMGASTLMDVYHRIVHQTESPMEGCSSSALISTGSNALNSLISKTPSRKRLRSENLSEMLPSSGGLQSSKITQVSGPSGCGKTQMALSLVAHALLLIPNNQNMNIDADENLHAKILDDTDELEIHYIASGGGSAGLVPLARRLRHILTILLTKQEQKRQRRSYNGQTETHAESIALNSSQKMAIQKRRDGLLNHVVFDHASDGYELISTLDQFEKRFHKRQRARRGSTNTTNRHEHVRGHSNPRFPGNHLVVIDSISSCLAPMLYGDGDKGVGAALLNEVHLMLRRISRLSSSIPASPSTLDVEHVNDYDHAFNGNERVSVFVTNGMVSDHQVNQHDKYHKGGGSSGGMNGRKPALGEIWRASDVHIVLEAIGEMDVITESSGRAGLNDLKRIMMKRVAAHLRKNSAGPCMDRNMSTDNSTTSIKCEFRIGPAGVMDLE